LLDAQNATLTTLLRNLRKSKVTDPKFEWFEDAYLAQSTTVATPDTSSADTDFIVAAGTGIYGRVYDLWMCSETGEVVMITAISTDTWTVIRGVGSGGGTPIDSGDTLFYIGNAIPTGKGERAKLSTQTAPIYNYTQLMKEGLELTRTADMTNLFGGPERTYLRRKHAEQHLRDIERTFWFGKRDDLIQSDSPTASVIPGMDYTTRGVLEFLATNESENLTGSMTEDEFELILEGAFRYGNSTKFMFCAPRACTVIDSWGRAKLELVPKDTTYGIEINRYKSSHGELNIIMNRLFYDFATGGTFDTDGPYRDYGKFSCILDLEYLGYKYLLDTILETDIQENDAETFEDQYRTQAGLFLAHETHHTEIHNWSLS